jgi:hypothetical protein
MPDAEVVRRVIMQLGERDGLTAERLESSPLIDLMDNTPPGWSVGDRAAALGRLLTEMVNEMSGLNLRSAAQVALNLGGRPDPGVIGSGAMARVRLRQGQQ